MFTAALVILKLNVIWIYSCDAVILNTKTEYKAKIATFGVKDGQHHPLKMNLVFYFSGECDGKLYNLLSVCESTGSLGRY